MRLYRIRKWDEWCNVTKMQYIEYERKWWKIEREIESNPLKARDEKDLIKKKKEKNDSVL